MNERMNLEIERTIEILQDYMPEPKKAPPHKQTDTLFRRPVMRLGTAIIIVTVILCTAGLGCAVYFSGALNDYFAGRASDGNLSANQQLFIEEKSVGIGQSITSGGYTVTIDSAICDAQNLLILLRVEGPEDVVLDMAPSVGNCYFDSVTYNSPETVKQHSRTVSFSRSWRHIDDGDGLKNTVTLLMTDQRIMENGILPYTDGEVWSFTFSNLSTTTGEFYNEKTVLTDKVWQFEFRLSEVSSEKEIIDAPVICQAVETGKDSTADIVVTSFVIQPFGAVCEYTFPGGEQPGSIDILDVQLVMKDGSTVNARPKAGGGSGASGSGTMIYAFDIPLVIEDVEYLMLPGCDPIALP